MQDIKLFFFLFSEITLLVIQQLTPNKKKDISNDNKQIWLLKGAVGQSLSKFFKYIL